MKAKYRKFLAGLQLRHFSPEELIAQAERTRGGVRNSIPPEELWENIVPTLWVADQARRHAGKSLIITSAYRSEDYNRAVGGASRSQHKRNSALDIIPGRGLSVTRLYNILLGLRQAGAFKGGLGKYPSFVHIDTRGVNATWGG